MTGAQSTAQGACHRGPVAQDFILPVAQDLSCNGANSEAGCYRMGPKSWRLMPNSRRMARTVPGARSLEPQSGTEATFPVEGLYQMWWLPLPERSYLSAVAGIPGDSIVGQVPGSASDRHQHLHRLRTVGHERTKSRRRFYPQLLPGFQKATEGFLNVVQNLVRSAALSNQARNVRAGDRINALRVGLQKKSDKKELMSRHFASPVFQNPVRL